MAQAALKISATLALPLDYVTKTCAILAQRRKGKTYTASVIAEELVRAGQPFVALDPTGAWWGLRSSADGKKAGLPVVVLGGQHGDLDIDRHSGRLIADLVLDQPGWYVIDFGMFESAGAERQFATDFAERLYRRKGQPGMDFPLHLFVDEADRFIPQRVTGGKGDDRESDQRLLGAFEAIVRRGGLRGLGTTLISQRAAVVNKNVLEQVDMLVVLRTLGPNDRRAIEGYLVADVDSEQTAVLMASVGSLGIGEAWVWEPGGEPPLFERVQIRQRKTFNSSATPKAGQVRIEARAFAEVDLGLIKERMADSLERAKADDPKLLREKIAAQQNLIMALEAAKADANRRADAAEARPSGGVDPEELADWRYRWEAWARALDAAALDLSTRAGELRTVINRYPPPPDGTKQGTKLRAKSPATPGPLPVTRESSGFPPSNEGTKLGSPSLPGGAPKDILTVLVQRGIALEPRRAGWLAGHSSRKSTVRNALSTLRKLGFITDAAAGGIIATQAGVEALGPIQPLPSGEELRDHWLAELGDGAPSRLLRAMLDAHPHELGPESLAAAACVAAGTSTLRNAMSTLRAQGLVVDWHLDPDFMEAIGAE